MNQSLCVYTIANMMEGIVSRGRNSHPQKRVASFQWCESGRGRRGDQGEYGFYCVSESLP